jgi:hypothetical protein
MLIRSVAALSSQRSVVLVAAALLCVGLSTGCDKSDGSAAKSNAGATGADESAVESAEGDLFEESFVDKPCDLLTPKMVANTFGVPEDEIKQRESRRSCKYDWQDDSRRLEAFLTQIRLFETEKEAADRFDKATTSMTGKEVAQAMGHAVEDAKKKEEIDSKDKEKAADHLADVVTPEGGINFEDIEGIGDQARANTTAGSIVIRVDNLNFEVSAYHGASMKKPEKTDLESIKKAIKQWEKDSLPDKKRAAKKLAPVVVENL